MRAKEDYRDSAQYQRDLALDGIQDQAPIDPKLANLCLKDTVDRLGANTSGTTGGCELSDQCSFTNDKISGISGFCLKSVVGVNQEL